MKSIFTFLWIVCSVSLVSAKGIPCETLEYTELKDMDKNTLLVTYCNYKRRIEANQAMIIKYQDFSPGKAAQVCLNEILKLDKLYRKVYGEDPPECD